MTKIAIVDDSRLARVELKAQLDNIADVECVGEADSVASAVDLIERTTVNAVLLDIDLPDGDGFDVLARLSDVPQVIFVTAFNEYAIKSFEFNALDYLLKPVREARLRQAIEKIKQPSLSPLENSSRFFIKDRDRCYFVAVEEVIAFEAMGNYTRVHLMNAVPSVYRPIGAVEERLPQNQFFRASRSWIINTQFVDKFEPGLASGSLLAFMSNGMEVSISKRQSVEFRRRWAL